jgi:DNA-binding LytR/AlgR family response regulator
MPDVLRTLVVDDEPLANERLVDLLRQVDQVEIVGRATSGAEAITKLNEVNPDLLLLDIEMPKIDGFDVVESLRRSLGGTREPPLICFVTAYPHFAAEAFETGALDFLCKPVRLSRLQKMAERAMVAMRQREAQRRIDDLFAQLETLRHARLPREERSIWLHQRGEMIRIAVDSIDWIKAEGEYVRLQLRDRSYLLRNSITAVATDLADEGFIRIHRSVVVNRSRVAGMRSTRSAVHVELVDGTELPVGRRFRASLREHLNSDL